MWWQLLILQVGFFVLLIFMLEKLFHGQLKQAVARIGKLQEQNRRKEEELLRYQEKIKAECEKKIQEANEEARLTRNGITDEIQAMNERARAALEEQKAFFLTEMAAKEQTMRTRLEQEADERAARAAGRVLENAFSEKMLKVLHQELIEELLEALDKYPRQNIDLGVKSIRVKSAFPLTPKEKQALMQKISSWLDSGKHALPEVVEQVDPSLVAGFIISLGEQVLDGSLKSRFAAVSGSG